MGRVSTFISTEETRYYLNGVAWQTGAFGRRFVATDGHRMGICRYDSEPRPDSTRIVPFKAVAILARHFAGRDVGVSEAAPGSNAPALRFSAGNLDFRTKLIDGKFPEIERVLPDGSGAAIMFKRAEVHAALARLMAAGRANYGLGIKLSGQNGHCAIERTLDCGQARVATSTAWPAEAAPFGVSALYFADMMYACDGDPSLVVKSPSDPILIRDIDPTMTRVLMPRRI